MIILVGASASGKTELAKILYQKYGYQKCITTTTRSPRQNELNGKDYHFVSKDHFETLESADAFVEVTAYHEHKYGLQKKDVLENGIVIVDPNGANHLTEKLKDQAYVVYVASDEDIRQSRMLSRGDDLIKIQQRLIVDREVFNEEVFQKINLKIENHHEPLERHAAAIHNAYQLYLTTTVHPL